MARRGWHISPSSGAAAGGGVLWPPGEWEAPVSTVTGEDSLKLELLSAVRFRKAWEGAERRARPAVWGASLRTTTSLLPPCQLTFLGAWQLWTPRDRAWPAHTCLPRLAALPAEAGVVSTDLWVSCCECTGNVSAADTDPHQAQETTAGSPLPSAVGRKGQGWALFPSSPGRSLSLGL